jgi:DNA polymerase-3 subunit delta
VASGADGRISPDHRPHGLLPGGRRAAAGEGRLSPTQAGTARTGLWKRLPTEEDLRGGLLPPIVLLTGSGRTEGAEEYLVEEAFRFFWEKVTDPATADFNRDLFHADEVRAEELFAQAGSFPMMAERRLVVLKRCEKAPAALLKDLLSYLDQPSPTTCLLLIGWPLDKRRKVWTRVLKEAAVFEFPPLGSRQLALWLGEACAGLGRRLPPALAAGLAEQLAHIPLRMARQEVEKICLLVEDGAEVRELDLAHALGMEADARPFDLVDAILAENTPRALTILRSLSRVPDNAFILPGILGKSLGRLAFAAQLRDRGHPLPEIEARLKLNPYQMRPMAGALARWPQDRLEEALRLVLEADMALKGDSPLPPSQITFQLVVRLCRRP